MTETDKKENSSGQRCPYFKTCEFIQSQEDKLPRLTNQFKENYCLKNYYACSRRWIQDFLGAEKVPELMMPQQHDWAEQLLFESGVRYTAFQQKYRSSRPDTDSK
ncbi:MAG: hypothetical protein ISS71_00405 [Phycisphaerae bacterium]|nr:hypothetical protein [Phycisphaerae bacterium]